MGLVILFINSASFSLLPWTPSTIGYFGLLCVLFMFPNSWLSNLLCAGFWWQGRWVFEFQNYDDSFSGWYLVHKELLNFLAVISQKYSRIHIIIIENFKNMVPSIFFDRSNLEKEYHTNYNLKNKNLVCQRLKANWKNH